MSDITQTTPKNRRDFLKTVTIAGAVGMTGLATRSAETEAKPSLAGNFPDQTDRGYWLEVMDRIASPVVENLARRQLKKNMPIEAANPADRGRFTHLEAWGRLLAGLAPWLAATGLSEPESGRQQKYIALVRESMDAATDPRSPDFLNFNNGGQALVDSAFMAQGILRCPTVLWQKLDPRVQQQVIDALKSSRAISTPHGNNWVMFAAMVEAALQVMGQQTIERRLEHCVQEMLSYYKGDGAYGDGEYFHWDYYNSFVIHPMLLDVLALLKQKDTKWTPIHDRELQRARRYAVIQERLIAPDGTFPSIGRSTTYRFGAFQVLAQIAWMRKLPKPVKPAQVRCALTAVIRRMITAPGTFDENGWLQIGFCGHQPTLAEGYISTGSLYLCAAALLPLGLSPADEFWSAPPARWTSQQLWSGESLPADHALSEAK